MSPERSGMGGKGVLLVDGSSVSAHRIAKCLERQPSFQIVGVAATAFEAREILVHKTPAVMVLALNLPEPVNSFLFLEKVMKHWPVPTLLLLENVIRESPKVAKVNSYGLVETFLANAAMDPKHFEEEFIKRLRSVLFKGTEKKAPGFVNHSPVTLLGKPTQNVIAVASSTGGTEALKVFLGGFPADLPPMVIVQHMPAGFTRTYAQALNALFPFEVKEAEEGDRLQQGRVLLAPGDYHMEILKQGAHFCVHFHKEAPLHGVRPAADYLFHSVAKSLGKRAVGVVLTGMGKDGAAGLLAMKNEGALNFAQDEQSCVVFGMPREAISKGAIDKVLPLPRLAGAVLEIFRKNASGPAG